MQLLSGFLLAVAVSLVAWRLRALSISGALAAVFTGTMVFGLGGLAWAVPMLTFFISSSVLSRAFGRRKAVLNEKFSKGSQRDWQQVLANGGMGALLVIFQWLQPGELWPWVAYAGSMAAVNADTWATEMGVLSRQLPRLITTGQVVEKGTSGGISITGSLAALAGGALVGLAALTVTPQLGLLLVLVAAAGGLVGAMFDSLLGATIQAIYSCSTCCKETERHPYHTCGTQTVQVRGWRLINNEVVNFACAAAGAAAAAGLWLLL